MSWPDAANLGVEGKGVQCRCKILSGVDHLLSGALQLASALFPPLRQSELLQFSRIRGLDGENHVPGAPLDEFGMGASRITTNWNWRYSVLAIIAGRK